MPWLELLLSRMQDYRRLRVWQKAHRLALDVRRATDSFPRRSFGSIASQMTRAAESIVFNIAEGCGASSAREFARFLEMSIRSASELESQLELAYSYGVLQLRTWEAMSSETTDCRRMLVGLRAKVLASAGSPKLAEVRRTEHG